MTIEKIIVTFGLLILVCFVYGVKSLFKMFGISITNDEMGELVGLITFFIIIISLLIEYELIVPAIVVGIIAGFGALVNWLKK